MYVFGRYILLFLIYSFLGGLGEMIFRLITEHQLYGIHGFLHLPIMPIYGFGALLIVAVMRGRAKHPILLFLGGALLATMLEFIANWLIEIIFHTRIWDYSHKAFSFDGRVSLDNSIGFGIAAVLLVYLIHPFVWRALQRIPKQPTIIIATLLLAIVLVDIVVSVIERLS